MELCRPDGWYIFRNDELNESLPTGNEGQFNTLLARTEKVGQAV